MRAGMPTAIEFCRNIREGNRIRADRNIVANCDWPQYFRAGAYVHAIA
jgi:hypothetical protein